MISRKLVWISCAAALLGGCAGGGTQSLAPATTPANAAHQSAGRHGWISPAAKKMKLTYVSDFNSSIILIYQQGAEASGPIGEIVDGLNGPQGIAVDSQGTLYVANLLGSTVTEYPAGSTSPSVTLSTDISHPLDVSVDKKGIVYVSMASSSTVLEFEPGNTYPTTTVSIPHPSGVTNSKKGTLYLAYNPPSEGKVGRCRSLAPKCKDLGITASLAQGIWLDSQGNLLVGDGIGSVINIYAPGSNTPFRTIQTPLEQPSKFAMTGDDGTLYIADPANFAIRLYDYASGQEMSHFTFGSDELEGVALYPGQKPGPG